MQSRTIPEVPGENSALPTVLRIPLEGMTGAARENRVLLGARGSPALLTRLKRAVATRADRRGQSPTLYGWR
jgi:hypothetical protein